MRGLTHAIGAIALAASTAGAAEDWPDYRGPRFDGHSDARGVPLHWSETDNVAWKTPVPGRGWSSPVVAGGRVWLTTADAEAPVRFRALAFDAATGKPLHDIVLFEAAEPAERHPLNSYASPSPVLGGGRVYAHFGTYGTACIEATTGRVRWRRDDLHCDHLVGPGSSPLLYDGLLVLLYDGADAQFVSTLDADTGRTAWRTARSVDLTPFREDERKAYSTPIPVVLEGSPGILAIGAQAVMVYEPRTGRERWQARFKGFSASARPVTGGGMVFLNTGFDRSDELAIRLEGEGRVGEEHMVWREKSGVQARSSPLYLDGLLYQVNTGGQAKCFEAATGRLLWTERVGKQTSASPVAAEGRVYTFDESGLATVFRPGRAFERLAENRLDAGFMASPAVVNGALFLRTETHLYRIGR